MAGFLLWKREVSGGEAFFDTHVVHYAARPVASNSKPFPMLHVVVAAGLAEARARSTLALNTHHLPTLTMPVPVPQAQRRCLCA